MSLDVFFDLWGTKFTYRSPGMILVTGWSIWKWIVSEHKMVGLKSGHLVAEVSSQS